MNVSIIIVNYNTKEITLACISSIIQFTKEITYEIIVVDNASVDGSCQAIRNEFSSVIVIQLTENVGFGRANNLGAKNANGDILFLLNSDTVFVENSLKKLVDFFGENEKSLNIGVLGTILVDTEMNINGYGSEFPKPHHFYQEAISKIPFLNRFIKHNDSKIYNTGDISFHIDYVIGADMLVRKNLFEKFDGFDPDYFMYYEESDLQLRMHRKGLRNYIFTGTRIIHLEDGSGKMQPTYSNRKRIILHKSKIFYIKKNFFSKYFQFRFVDKAVLLLHLFNRRYTLKENYKYIKAILKTY